MDNEDIIEGGFDDLFNELDKNELRRKAEQIGVFYNTLVDADVDMTLIYECVMNEFYNIYL